MSLSLLDGGNQSSVRCVLAGQSHPPHDEQQTLSPDGGACADIAA